MPSGDETKNPSPQKSTAASGGSSGAATGEAGGGRGEDRPERLVTGAHDFDPAVCGECRRIAQGPGDYNDRRVFHYVKENGTETATVGTMTVKDKRAVLERDPATGALTLTDPPVHPGEESRVRAIERQIGGRRGRRPSRDVEE